MIIPVTLALLASFLMLFVGLVATLSPSSFVRTWMKRGVVCGGGTPGQFLTVGGIGASALSIAVTSLLSLLENGDLPIVPMPAPFADYLSASRAISLGMVAILLVYMKMWYAGNMAQRLGANRIATDIAFTSCLAIAGYSLLKSPESEESALAMVKAFNNLLVPWSLAHYIFPALLRLTFSIELTEAETILTRAACSFFLANHILQASIARGVEPVRAVSYMALVMLLSSLDFQLRCNPKWGIGSVPEGVEIDWSRVNGVRTWSIVSLGILYCL